MNIAVFADVHGRILLCFKLCARWEKETGQRIDLILQAGDLGAFPDERRLDRATRKYASFDPTELGFLTDFVDYDSEVAAMLNKTQCNLIFVRGNHEDHHWLDALEQNAREAIFPVDVYQRVYCLKSGVPYTFQSNAEQITLLGIGRVGARVGEQDDRQPKYIQEYERERIYALEREGIDLLLTHDSPRDAITPGFGMEEIRLVLDRYRPHYHFFGHCGGPCLQRTDTNGKTISCKLADLHWTQRQMLEDGSMGTLRWENSQEHIFEVISPRWMKEYTSFSWKEL